ncbi:MAG TPA: pirin family protein [Polyangiaceae bacterium]|nr:pirin family protein [Polyangiaceae bacterium]
MDRRSLLGALVTAPLAEACRSEGAPPPPRSRELEAPIVLGTEPLGFQWRVPDPFLFCAHHDDSYPAGNAELGPATSLAGRELGMDFSHQSGFSMYHGRVVPGFPEHPHRGFETVTIVREGLVDHADSLGAAARYGGGDVQWLTAGSGIVHAEMFPLLDQAAPNPLELFQIWLNLPSQSKFVAPYFSMLWRDMIPRTRVEDANGRKTELTVIAGELGGVHAAAPPPHSYAARTASDLAIWTLKLEPHAEVRLPPALAGSNRMLYFFRGDALSVAGRAIAPRHSVDVRADASLALVNGPVESELLLLQGRPLGEPVVQRGPFVMNTEAEIRQAFADYRATGFGGWPWPRADPVLGPDPARYARHADGRTETAG